MIDIRPPSWGRDRRSSVSTTVARLGSAFAGLAGADSVRGDLEEALGGPSADGRAAHLGAALVTTARRLNELGICASAPDSLVPFHDRPFPVIGGEGIAATLLASIGDARLRTLPLTGVCDQYVDSTDALQDRRLLEGATQGLLARRAAS